MNRNEEPRVLRLEAEANRLEARLAAAEARAAQLEQTRRPPGAGGAAPVPLLVSFLVNLIIDLNGVADGSWGGTTVTVLNGSSISIWTGTTDNWGYCTAAIPLAPTEIGQAYTVSITHTGFTTQVISGGTIGPGTNGPRPNGAFDVVTLI